MIERIAGAKKCKWFYTICPYMIQSVAELNSQEIITSKNLVAYNCSKFERKIDQEWNRIDKCKKGSPDGLYIIDWMGISDLGGML